MNYEPRRPFANTWFDMIAAADANRRYDNLLPRNRLENSLVLENERPQFHYSD